MVVKVKAIKLFSTVICFCCCGNGDDGCNGVRKECVDRFVLFLISFSYIKTVCHIVIPVITPRRKKKTKNGVNGRDKKKDRIDTCEDRTAW